MAQFPEIRRCLARFRRNLEFVLVAEAIVFGGLMFVMWLLTGDAMFLLLTIVTSCVPLISIWSLRRDIRPDQDLRRTVRLLNSKKKLCRSRFGLRVRFSAKWFPFPEIAPIRDIRREKTP